MLEACPWLDKKDWDPVSECKGHLCWGHRRVTHITAEGRRVCGLDAGGKTAALVGARGLSFMIASVFSLK